MRWLAVLVFAFGCGNDHAASPADAAHDATSNAESLLYPIVFQ